MNSVSVFFFLIFRKTHIWRKQTESVYRLYGRCVVREYGCSFETEYIRSSSIHFVQFFITVKNV